MRASIAFVSIVLMSIVTLRPAEACKCTGTLEAGIEKADVVFWGEVTAVASVKRPYTGTRYTVAVKGVWKGDAKATMFVVTGNSSCGLQNVGVKVGVRFLFAARRQDGVLYARQCDGSRTATSEVREEATKIAGAEHAPG
jgi:hypothetical protein